MTTIRARPGPKSRIRSMATSATRSGYLDRLKRIEGQARGIRRMVEEEQYCIDILTQISARHLRPQASPSDSWTTTSNTASPTLPDSANPKRRQDQRSLRRPSPAWSAPNHDQTNGRIPRY